MFIIVNLFGWEMKDGTRRYKLAYIDQKHMHDHGLWQVLFAGLALAPELKDTWTAIARRFGRWRLRDVPEKSGF